MVVGRRETAGHAGEPGEHWDVLFLHWKQHFVTITAVRVGRALCPYFTGKNHDSELCLTCSPETHSEIQHDTNSKHLLISSVT